VSGAGSHAATGRGHPGPPRADLEARLSELLPGRPDLRIVGAASVGAQRETLMIEVAPQTGTARTSARDRPLAAVAQISSGPLDGMPTALEVAIIESAARSGVRVPRVLASDAEHRVIISERVDGETIPRRILRSLATNARLGPELARECGRCLARLHAMPIGPFRAFAELDDRTRPLGYVETLAGLVEALEVPSPSFRLGLRWLSRHATAMPRPTCLVHGDFRNGNLIVEAGRLVAVLDWELAHLGDPMEDLAWLCLRTWRFGADENEVGGFGPFSFLREGYEEAGGVFCEESFRWWTVARTLWWGIGLARQAKAFMDGDTKSIVLAASGRRVAELEYDLLMAIG
jgi:aminoglycoside phosphotransferase (APT) family kinase protein